MCPSNWSQRQKVVSLAFASSGHEGRFYPSYKIFSADIWGGNVIQQAHFQMMLFDSDAEARAMAQEYMDDWLHGLTIQGCMRRIGRQQVYGYAAKVCYGRRAFWEAKIYCDGKYRGTPSGVIADNPFRGPALDKLVATLVEGTINVGAGFSV